MSNSFTHCSTICFVHKKSSAGTTIGWCDTAPRLRGNQHQVENLAPVDSARRRTTVRTCKVHEYCSTTVHFKEIESMR